MLHAPPATDVRKFRARAVLLFRETAFSAKTPPRFTSTQTNSLRYRRLARHGNSEQVADLYGNLLKRLSKFVIRFACRWADDENKYWDKSSSSSRAKLAQELPRITLYVVRLRCKWKSSSYNM